MTTTVQAGTTVVPAAGPVPVQTVRYQCPWCRRTWAKKTAAERHVARCWRNPATRSCKTCAHFVPAEPGAGPCFPGQWCACGEGEPEWCRAEVDLDGGLRTDCPLWAPAEGGVR